MHTYTTEELRERKALTDAIVANLRFIAEHDVDLDELERQTSAIVSNLQTINEDMRRRTREQNRTRSRRTHAPLRQDISATG